MRTRSFYLLLLLALWLGVTLSSACSHTRANSPCGFGVAPLSIDDVEGEPELETQMLGLINEARGESGLAELVFDEHLVAIARAHSHDMADAGFVGHDSPTTGTLENRLHHAGYLARVARENVALNQSVVRAHQSLMTSPSHLENILARDVTVAGIGIVEREGDILVTQVFADPVELGDPQAVRGALIDLVNETRRGAGLEALRMHDRLQSVAEEQVGNLRVPLQNAGLDAIGQTALEVVRADPTLQGIAVTAQTGLDEVDLSVPQPSQSPDAAALAVAVRIAEDDRGRPTLVILVLIGMR